MKDYCEWCNKNCKEGEELCSTEEQEEQRIKLVNILKGG